MISSSYYVMMTEMILLRHLKERTMEYVSRPNYENPLVTAIRAKKC